MKYKIECVTDLNNQSNYYVFFQHKTFFGWSKWVPKGRHVGGSYAQHYVFKTQKEAQEFVNWHSRKVITVAEGTI